VSGYLLRVLRHHLGAGRGLFLLTVFGVALGVASVLSIQILNLSAVGAFSGAMKAISGPADLTVRAARGSLPEEHLPTVLGTRGVARAWPVLDVTVALEDGDDEAFLRVLGLDVYSGVGIPWAGESGDLTAALATPGWAAVSPRICAQRGWAVGGRVPVSSGSRRFELVVGAAVDFEKRTPTAGSRLAVMDLGQAQEALGMAGRLHQVDLVVRDDASVSEVAERLRARLGPGLRVVTPEVRRDRTAGLLSAFRLNLTALSLVSLVVGFFLVIAATQASLTRRRKELGLLRSLGAQRGQVLALVLAEVAILGTLGVALGIPLGWGAAAANLDVVAGTLSNLYLIQETERLVVPGWLLLVAAGVGIFGSLAGAVAPALDVTGRHPRELLGGLRLHDQTARRATPLLLAGIALVAIVFGWYAAGGSAWCWPSPSPRPGSSAASRPVPAPRASASAWASAASAPSCAPRPSRWRRSRWP
jgi:putative ABC transport system permease protein